MITTRSRLVRSNETVLNQVDILQNDAYTRVVGLGTSDVTVTVFFQNQAQPWPTVLGTTVTDTQVASGSIYFNEIPGSAGYYNLRFRPNSVGFWRLVLAYPAGSQLFALDFDVTTLLPQSTPGLIASFVKPHC